jgi:xanthine dehydrogenase YagT iron-sulfur-binding subunit
VFNEYTGKAILQDGAEVTLARKPGDVFYSGPVTHRISNTGKTPIHNLIVELKDAAKQAPQTRIAAGTVTVLHYAGNFWFHSRKGLSMARKKDKPGGLTFNRRDFLKSAGVVSAVTAAVSPPEVEAQGASGGGAVGPGEVPVRLQVNGKRLDLMIEPRVTLLDALRMRADLTGNKRGCDRGACGACTMIVDGRAVYSCSTLAIEVQGKQIRTVDGLADGSTLHPVQQAFCEKDALMCGFCTPGFVMASVALLEKNPTPTPEQIRRGLDGNICRCGTFSRIFEAVSSVKGVRRG